MEIWDLFDKEGNPLNKTIQRGEIMKRGEYHRVVHLWFYNDKKELLIQKRNKPLYGVDDMWACTGGCVTAGESTISAAVRETEEEMGIVLESSKFTLLSKGITNRNLEDIWIAEWNGTIEDVTIDPVEVQDAAWVSMSRINEMISSGELYNYGEDYFSKIISYINS